MTKELQAPISGGARGGARRAEKIFFEIGPPPPYLRIWMTAFPPLPLSEGLHPPLRGYNRCWL